MAFLFALSPRLCFCSLFTWLFCLISVSAEECSEGAWSCQGESLMVCASGGVWIARRCPSGYACQLSAQNDTFNSDNHNLSKSFSVAAKCVLQSEQVAVVGQEQQNVSVIRSFLSNLVNLTTSVKPNASSVGSAVALSVRDLDTRVATEIASATNTTLLTLRTNRPTNGINLKISALKISSPYDAVASDLFSYSYPMSQDVSTVMIQSLPANGANVLVAMGSFLLTLSQSLNISMSNNASSSGESVIGFGSGVFTDGVSSSEIAVSPSVLSGFSLHLTPKLLNNSEPVRYSLKLNVTLGSAGMTGWLQMRLLDGVIETVSPEQTLTKVENDPTIVQFRLDEMHSSQITIEIKPNDATLFRFPSQFWLLSDGVVDMSGQPLAIPVPSGHVSIETLI